MIGFTLSVGSTTDEARRALLKMYEALAGEEYVSMVTGWLAHLLRLRAQHAHAGAARAHRYGSSDGGPKVNGRPAALTSGRAIAAHLHALALTRKATHGTAVPTWVTDKRLALAIDEADTVNLGGAGGRNRGKTPEAWAKEIVKILSKPAANRKTSGKT